MRKIPSGSQTVYKFIHFVLKFLRPGTSSSLSFSPSVGTRITPIDGENRILSVFRELHGKGAGRLINRLSLPCPL